MMSERRKFMRFDVSLDVAFKISNGSEKYFTGVTKNFSRNGLCFESDMFGPALKTPMELSVKLPGQDKFVSVSGNVAWEEQFKDKCWIGIELEEMNKEAKSRILDYAYDLWVEENKNPKSDRQG